MCCASPANARSVMEVVEAIGMLHGVQLGQIIERVAAIAGRGAGTDAERRAAVLLAADVGRARARRVDRHALAAPRLGVAGRARLAARRRRQPRLGDRAARGRDRRGGRRAVPRARGRGADEPAAAAHPPPRHAVRRLAAGGPRRRDADRRRALRRAAPRARAQRPLARRGRTARRRQAVAGRAARSSIAGAAAGAARRASTRRGSARSSSCRRWC